MSETARAVRERILADHARLRISMADVLSHARAAVLDEKVRPDVREALAKLRAELERHLQFEDDELVPLLHDADAWGAVRAEHMANDHTGQRAVLLALTEDAGEGVRTTKALAEEVEWFVESFERDMRDEEATLLSDEALGESSLVQTDIGD